MKLAAGSREELAEFFREQIKTTGLSLEKVRFIAGPFTLIILKLLKVNGLTLGRRVFVLTETDGPGQRLIPAVLAAHELCHVFQYERHGGVKFLARYLIGYWKCLRRQRRWNAEGRMLAYLSIPEEVEAQATENNFIQWRRARKSGW